MLANFRAHRYRRRTQKVADEYYSRAVGQIRRLTEDGSADTGGALLAGEAEMLSLTSRAATAVESAYATKLTDLRTSHQSVETRLSGLREQRERSTSERHVVNDPCQVGAGPLTLDEMSTRAAELTELIDDETRRGSTRHRHHVSRTWRILATGVVIVDVAALFMLMLTIENTSFRAFALDPAAEAAKMITAAGFALLAATVLAIASHTLGHAVFRRIHRSVHASDQGLGHLADSRSAILTGTAMMVVLSALVGWSIDRRIVTVAEGTKVSGLADWVGATIGLCALFAPIVVAAIAALGRSPEVEFRDSLAALITSADQRRAKIDDEIVAVTKLMSSVDEKCRQLLVEADRDLRAAFLPANQLILRLRTEFGHAGELYVPLHLPGNSDRRELGGWAHLERLRALVEPNGTNHGYGGPHVVTDAA
ncbi:MULTISPECIES: hypothetical protein [Gordonia]|uniref:hypothetical protein n=1 Tax=Gordonia TaxID=2053 RepID=UPI00036EF995|nr:MULTISPECIES: hypothetical protein [Gordonia]OPX06178.1 hypothetical protein B1964_28850 [Gordonia sp. i37]